jgi:hypothetical protein
MTQDSFGGKHLPPFLRGAGSDDPVADERRQALRSVRDIASTMRILGAKVSAIERKMEHLQGSGGSAVRGPLRSKTLGKTSPVLRTSKTGASGDIGTRFPTEIPPNGSRHETPCVSLTSPATLERRPSVTLSEAEVVPFDGGQRPNGAEEGSREEPAKKEPGTPKEKAHSPGVLGGVLSSVHHAWETLVGSDEEDEKAKRKDTRPRDGFWNTDDGEQEDQQAVVKYLQQMSQQPDKAAGTQEADLPRYMLLPLGNKRIYWDIAGMTLILYISITIPFELAFAETYRAMTGVQGEYSFFSFAAFIDYFFMIDIFLNFSTAYYRRGELITDRRRIALNYMTGFFLMDLAASIPYDMIISLSDDGTGEVPLGTDATKGMRGLRMIRMMRMVRALRIIRLVRIFRLRTILYKLEEAVQSQAVVLCMSMCKYLAVMVYLAHWEACAWHAIGAGLPQVDENGEEVGTWIDALQDAESDFSASKDAQKNISQRYVASLYWAITTMSTVGYGDIVPVNTAERIFAISAMVSACGMFAMIIGSMQNVLSKFGEERLEFDRMLVRTMRYLRSQKVAVALQQKVKLYLEHNFENRSLTGMDQKVLGNLSATLKSEVKLALLLPIVESYPLFEKSSRPMLVRVCSVCVTHRHAPGDIVYDAGTVAKSMVFLVSGKLLCVTATAPANDAGAPANDALGEEEAFAEEEINEGGWIGAVHLFVSEIRTYTLVSVSFAELLEITQDAFRQILENFPTMEQKYHEYRDRVLAGDREAVEFPCPVKGEGSAGKTLKQRMSNALGVK